MGNTEHFKLSTLKLLLVLLILFIFEYFSFSILSMPYEELERNADRYHPIMAYLFFIPVFIFIGLLILIFVRFLFKRNKGLTITESGIIDCSSPFSFGEIPFENISSISSITNSSIKYRFVKIKTNELNINLRKRKKDKSWWESKGLMGKMVKKMGTYTLPTKGFKASHQQIVETIKFFVEGKNIKVNEMDLQQIANDIKSKRG